MAGRFVRCSARKNFLTFQGLGRKDLGVPGRTTWRFKVRVTRIWEVTGYLREWFFLMGGKIHTTVRKQLLYLFQRKLEERLVYVLFVVDAKDLILILCFISRGLLRQLGEYRVP
ncbi:uncharacterized protein LOC123898107 isoform X5 [Trifolium pratense]|uniref:uncharacterized protein LOC123898107 isoform X5 n=1 Tax=Trifolium pratense TaxID=57577 RepID=UPI001E697207|nr:uncharacterized protein LOC123898107 isoform X5 [Trifolium pratense]